MKQEIVERLLIDRALGALSPDVQTLLEAHLENEPGDRQAALEIGDAVRLAKLSQNRRQRLPLPPLKWVPLPETGAARAGRRFIPELAALAASFLLGIGLGFWMLRMVEPSVPVSTADLSVAQLSAAEPPSSFWSLKRLAGVNPKVAFATQPRLTWRSLERVQSQPN